MCLVTQMENMLQLSYFLGSVFSQKKMVSGVSHAFLFFQENITAVEIQQDP